MSSVPSSADSCPARRSCLYMLRISSRWLSSRWRRASRRSGGNPASSTWTLSVLATLASPFEQTRKKVPYGTASHPAGPIPSGLTPLQGLAMIAHSSLNRERAVDLLIQHDTCQFMGERERAEREDRAGPLQHGAVEAEVGADQEGDRVRPLLFEPGEPVRELLGGEHLPPAVEGEGPGGRGKGDEQRRS